MPRRKYYVLRVYSPELQRQCSMHRPNQLGKRILKHNSGKVFSTGAGKGLSKIV